jgi:hypothetical protein
MRGMEMKKQILFGRFEEIASRDYEGIIRECQDKITKFLEDVSVTLCKQLGAGYNNADQLGGLK